MSTPTDSATQPAPHYCTIIARDDGTAEGCPSWPGCLFPGWHDDEPEPDDEDEIPGIGRSLATLAGFAAGCVIFLIACAILLPVIL